MQKIRAIVEGARCYLNVGIAERISGCVNHVPNLDVPEAVTGDLGVKLTEAGERKCIRHRNRRSASEIEWGTHVHIRRETSRELDEGRKGGVYHRGHGASSKRILVPEAFLLPVVPDLINHLCNHR